MFLYVCVGVSDMVCVYDFYVLLFVVFGLCLKFCEFDGWLGWMLVDVEWLLFFFGKLFDGYLLVLGNGYMIVFDVLICVYVDCCYVFVLW